MPESALYFTCKPDIQRRLLSCAVLAESRGVQEGRPYLADIMHVINAGTLSVHAVPLQAL